MSEIDYKLCMLILAIFVEKVCLNESILNAIVIRKTRVVGGYDSKIGHPFMVSMQINKVHHCGGSIISPKWVITAAHCLISKVMKKKYYPFLCSTIRGMLNLNDEKNQDRRYCERLFVHEKYVFNKHVTDDIGLILLRLPYTEEHVIQLPNFADLNNSIYRSDELSDKLYCTLMGWGYTETGKTSNELKEANLQLLTHEECKNRHFFFCLGPSTICVLENGTNGCYKDSGSPLICRERLYGIFTNGFCVSTHPSISVRIDYYSDWINKTITLNNSTKITQNLCLIILISVIMILQN